MSSSYPLSKEDNSEIIRVIFSMEKITWDSRAARPTGWLWTAPDRTGDASDAHTHHTPLSEVSPVRSGAVL